ncbi:hypothetical protein GE21DRAFT_3851 [Neurospora crassa]|uniref:Uncharacterized protein n=1 Tax=Neurospora crassa (strain ATCC 24698 / 74-OR23-1A / CBS 708.71 / DSM 1257 / FGSC 987) TaxID=367110 RepID=A7UXH2_NEUCR|nr:hypothetical protein NCU10629 [Neurospora crassa OR74A]EDO64875.2 hypothetical protein NCU10629 [Neurospora crassa OR74A]KHE84327.1 hypothetical protein GE21DRAFT_3851 [Neurospora crassa]|eukprot:XP_001727966.2 hypothetical protein NCU10629 [Neurospora crassa OR74A]
MKLEQSSTPKITGLIRILTLTSEEENRAQSDQVQAIIRDRLRNLNYDYAVVRAGPHSTQNQHDELGTTPTSPGTWASRGESAAKSFSYKVTFNYFEKVQHDKRDADDWHYRYLADATKRQYPKPGEPPAMEE